MTQPVLELNDDNLWDAHDVAKYLRTSRSWVYQRTANGLLPYLRIGGLVRFKPSAIRSYAEENAAGINTSGNTTAAKR